MNALVSNARVALRQYVRQPGFPLAIVCTLALTIGATAAVFSVAATLLVRDLPYAAPEKLVWIASVRSDNPSAPFSLPEVMDYRDRTRTLSGLAAYANWSASLAGEPAAERLQGARMSANAFGVLGVSPAAGRLLTERDDRPDAPQVVVISYSLWQRQFGGSAETVGKTVRINGEPFAIVGVLPPRFPLPLRDIDVVTPLAPDRDPLRHVRNSVNFLRIFGRLAPGAAASDAQAELTAICRSLRQQFPVEYARKDAVGVVSLHEALVGDYRRPVLLLLGAVGVVLATAVANLVSLSLLRTNGRRGELLTRIALGASRRTLAGQLAVEALLPSVVGSSLGVVLAREAIAVALLWVPSSVPRLDEVSFDRHAALFVVALTVAAASLLTAAPLGAIASYRAGGGFRPASRGAIGDRWNHRVRHALVVGEISAAFSLMLATAVLVQNLRQLNDVRPGFDPDGVFQARVSVPSSYRSPEDLTRFYERLSDRLAQVPGVARFGVISVAPLSGLLATVPFSVDGQQKSDRSRPNANLRAISPGYLATAGTPLVRGRSFSEADRAGTPHVALVSRALADRFLPEGSVGRRLLLNDNNEGPRPVEVVGVVENVRQDALDAPPALDIYVPLRQAHADNVPLLRNNQFWTIKTSSAPATFRMTFLAHLRAVDPDAAVSSAGAMRQYLDAWLAPRRFNLGLFGAFALTAVLLAVSGVYGLVAFAVSQRAPEIGLRMALGATPHDVYRMILGQAAALGVAGAGAGLVLATIARPIASSVIGTVQIGGWTAPATAGLLVAVVIGAAWSPARRAARIAPTVALEER